MFWRQTATTQQNHIEQLLDKSNVSLDELLDEDDLIQVTHAPSPQTGIPGQCTADSWLCPHRDKVDGAPQP